MGARKPALSKAALKGPCSILTGVLDAAGHSSLLRVAGSYAAVDQVGTVEIEEEFDVPLILTHGPEGHPQRAGLLRATMPGIGSFIVERSAFLGRLGNPHDAKTNDEKGHGAHEPIRGFLQQQVWESELADPMPSIGGRPVVRDEM